MRTGDRRGLKKCLSRIIVRYIKLTRCRQCIILDNRTRYITADHRIRRNAKQEVFYRRRFRYIIQNDVHLIEIGAAANTLYIQMTPNARIREL